MSQNKKGSTRIDVSGNKSAKIKKGGSIGGHDGVCQPQAPKTIESPHGLRYPKESLGLGVELHDDVRAPTFRPWCPER
jgi:hypothetical protein